MAYSSHSVDQLGSPFLLVDEGVFVIPKGGSMRLSKHHFKILFILSGQIDHEIEGLEGRQSLTAGDILVAPVVGRHRYINPNASKAIPMQAVRIFLDGEYLGQRARRRMKRPETDLSDFIVHHFNRVVQLRGGIDNKITALIRDFRSETEQRAAGYRHRIRSICTEMIVAVSRKISRQADRKGLDRGSNGGPIVSAAKEYVIKHYSKDMTLGEIAWHVGKGEEHLARVFKRETGQSVFDYVREIRVNQAKTMLLNPAWSLTEIAGRCGFHSLSFFSRTFRQNTGMSPSHYRRHTETVLQPQVGGGKAGR
jgi:AraC-like DNA-binding protein